MPLRHSAAYYTLKLIDTFAAHQLLNLLIVTTPIALIFDGPITHGLVMVVAAASLLIVASRIRPGEAAFLSRVIRPVAIVAMMPALYMLVQVLPLKISGFANPVWRSTAEALGQSLAGSITVDPGATLVSLARYNSAIAIILVSAALAINRNHAERILFALTAATTVIASLVIVERLGNFTFLKNSSNGLAGIGGIESAALGVNFAAATALHTFERSKAKRLTVGFRPIFVACLIAVVVTALAVLEGSGETYFAVVCGLTILAVPVIVRIFGVGSWGLIAIIAIASVILIVVITLAPNSQAVGLTLAFADHAPTQLIFLTHRILTETGWTGTGAGTFGAILPIYRDINELTVGGIAPTATAQIAIEMGQPFLWAILVAVAALVVLLFRGALRRRRDSIYCMAAASCVVTVTLLAFTNAALFSTPVLVLFGVAVGTAIAQSESRSI